MAKAHIFINMDIEADGPCPGLNSMLALGAEARDQDMNVLGHFYTTIETLPGAKPDPETTAWWLNQKREIYEAARKDPSDPHVAMGAFRGWINGMAGRAIPVACMAPTGFDWPFIYYYLEAFGANNPFNFRTLDGKTMMAIALRGKYDYIHGRDLPDQWFDNGLPHTHHALDDAKQQGAVFAKVWVDLQARFKEGGAK